MCGLVGCLGNALPENAKKAFYDLIYLDVLRGEDSTGVAAISNAYDDKTEVELFKSLGGATEFFWEHNLWKKGRSLTAKPVDIFIGHNRFATQGAITAANAHPFEFANVVGAHNGTVNKWSMRDFSGYKDFDIDSQIIYSHLSHTQNVNDVWKDADGALALSWYDKQRKQMNLIRNMQRPLYFAYSQDNKQVFWASESWMIMVAMSRNGINRHDVLECKPNQLYTFQTNDAKEVFHTETEVPPFVEKKWQGNHYGYQSGRNYYDGWEDWQPQQQQGNHKGGQQQKKQEAPTDPSKKGANLIIKEFHNIPTRPAAFGVLADGSTVRITIPLIKYMEAKYKLTEDKDNGFYFAQKLFKNVSKPTEFWCNWSDMKFIKLKPDVKIHLLKDGGFKVVGLNADANSAPWFDPKIRLNGDAFKTHTEKGCTCCGVNVTWAEKEDLLWVDQTTYYCGACRTLPLVEAYSKK